MPARKNHSEAVGQPAKPKPAAQQAKPRRSSVRRWAHGTLVAAGLATAKLSEGKDDAERPLFNVTVLDRLRVTITRYHD